MITTTDQYADAEEAKVRFKKMQALWQNLLNYRADMHLSLSDDL